MPGRIDTSCANRAQLATAWSTRGTEAQVLFVATLVNVLFVATPTSSIGVYYFCTCTVCGHPTYYYKIVGVAALPSLPAITATSYYKIVGVAALPSLPAITATSYYLSYCVQHWRHMYCLWPPPCLLFVCTNSCVLLYNNNSL